MKKTLALVLVLMLIPLFALADSNRVFDNAGLFSDQETIELNDAITVFQRKTNLDFAILTTDDYLGSYNQKAISDSFYDSQGFGLDKAYSGCLLYLDTNQGLIYLSTAGSLVALLEDEDTSQKLLDEINPSIKTGEFKEAVFLTLQFLTEYKTSL